MTTQEFDSYTPFTTLLSEANDFHLVVNTYSKIAYKYEIDTDTSDHFCDTSQLTREERIIVVVSNTKEFIVNWGFEYFLAGERQHDVDLSTIADCHKELGLIRAYDAFQRLLDSFPNRRVPADLNERAEIYNRLDAKTREEIDDLYFAGIFEQELNKTLADFIREHASVLIGLDQKEPTIWQRMRETGATKDLACASIGAISSACLFAMVFRQHAWFYAIASIAGIGGAWLGWAGRKLWKRMTAPRTGWLQELIDSGGREYLIVWKRFDEGWTKADIEFVRSVGNMFDAQYREMERTDEERIAFLCMQTINDAIGVELKGHNAEYMLRAIRLFFQLHFPQGSFVTRSRSWQPNEDRNAPELRWKQPQPLFESDEITPPWWLSVYMNSKVESDSNPEEG